MIGKENAMEEIEEKTRRRNEKVRKTERGLREQLRELRDSRYHNQYREPLK